VFLGWWYQGFVTPKARYDAIADWYSAWVDTTPGLLAEGVGEVLPRTIRGSRVLDVACGSGRATRGLAQLGATVVGVDLSSALIAEARAREASDPLGIDYRVADVTDLAEWWDQSLFDGAVCEMAMMDIDDLAGTVKAVAAATRVGGWFAISMVHPCFPGSDAGLSSWPSGQTYFDEGRWTSPNHNPDGVRMRVGSSHRTISTYLNTLIDAGFALERLVEPPQPVPTFLLLRCRRVQESAT
jgi:2-polyprenyl-3-methyl-5-hydroxy-6-metoxy-1,4-benzoquinol methylase